MKIDRRQSSLDREQVAFALHEWREEVDLRAFGATCPMPHCGALVVTYESSDSLREIIRSDGATWDFVCSECGAEFTAPRRDLLFQSVPREWLFSQICHA
jgi:hypothetical protein